MREGFSTAKISGAYRIVKNGEIALSRNTGESLDGGGYATRYRAYKRINEVIEKAYKSARECKEWRVTSGILDPRGGEPALDVKRLRRGAWGCVK